MTVPSAATDYDAVPYPSGIFPQTHPDRLATIATLHGLTPPRVDRCRVLELGCGDGTNLIAMAHTLPGGEFTGIDLSPTAIQRGQAVIDSMELENVRLRHLDLTRLSDDEGLFDYILAHGLYSWVPDGARNKLMEHGGRLLSEHGVAYISYNAYPGNHLRDLVRGMARFHVKQFDDPREQVAQAHSLIQFLATAKPEPGLWQQVLRQQLERMRSYADAGFYHDDLSPINHPVYFYEFAEHAARHGLQYLSEADPTDLLEDEFPAEVIARLQPLEGAGVLAREQYRDFLKGRSFRQTLLCRQDIEIDRQPDPRRVAGLHVAGEIRPAHPNLDPSRDDLEDFHGPKGAVIATPHPVAKAALMELGERWPAWIPFDDLLNLARARLQAKPVAHTASAENDALQLGEFLTRGHAVGFVELHSRPAPFVARVTERPRASDLARLLCQRGPTVPTLRHITLKLEDGLVRRLFLLLDGSHDVPALKEKIKAAVRDGETTLYKSGEPIIDPDEALGLVEPQVDSCLRHLAGSGVLVA